LNTAACGSGRPGILCRVNPFSATGARPNRAARFVPPDYSSQPADLTAPLRPEHAGLDGRADYASFPHPLMFNDGDDIIENEA